MALLGLIIFFISLFITYFSRIYFIKHKLIDKIKNRSSHKVLATRSGGSSIFITLFLVSLFLYINSNEIFDFSLIIPLGILYTIGLYDDIYQVDFKLKFIFQIIVAKILVDQGLLIDNLNGFFGYLEIPYMLAQFFTIFIIVLIVNAVNFSDGIDGLAITESIKGLLLIIFLSQSNLDFGLNYMFFIVIVAMLPLYIYNFRKNNKVFLGDSGSLFLGGIISIGVINLCNNLNYDFVSISSPLLIFIIVLYPIIDLINVVSRRIIKRKSPFKADKNHIHHFLIDKGYSHFQALTIITTCMGLLQLLFIYLSTN